MRLLITEFITGGGLANHPLPESLKQEGLMMLETLLADCSRIPGIELQVTLDSRIKLAMDGLVTRFINNEHDYMNTVRQISEQCGHSWVIAPESNGVLTQMVSMLEEVNSKQINCDSRSTYICSDKLLCNQVLSGAGVDVVPILSGEELLKYPAAVIVKKRVGAGCEGLQIFDNSEDAVPFVEQDSEWIAQPYIEGDHFSLSVIVMQDSVRVLSCNGQVLSKGRRPVLEACVVNQCIVTDQHNTLSEKIARCLPGLKGYVGIDFIQSKEKIYVVDINPRLSTSYVGLSRVLNHNPAKLCIDAAIHQILPEKIERKSRLAEVAVG